MSKNNETKIYLTILFLIMLSTFWRWFFDFSLMTHGDWYGHFPEALKEFMRFPSVWMSGGLGGVDLNLSFAPFKYLHGIMANIGFSYAIIERVIFFWPSVVICFLSSYFLSRYVTKSNLGGFIGSLVYSLNTYFMLGRTGHLTLMVSFSLAPLIILLFVKLLEERNNKLIIPLALTSFVSCFYELRAFYIIFWVLFFYFIFYLLFELKKKNIIEILKLFLFAIVPSLLLFLLNLYWLLPLSKTGAISNNDIFSRGLFGDQYLNILHSITLHHPFWSGGYSEPFVVNQVPAYFFLIPLLAILGLYFGHKNRLVVFFGFIGLVGIFLTKQSAEPIKEFYLILYNHFPGFNAFREASKFFSLIALSYSVLISVFVVWIWENLRDNPLKNVARYLGLVAVIIIFLANSIPFINGSIRTLFVPRTIPNDYELAREFINGQDEYFRTLWVPRDPRWSVDTSRNPRIGLADKLGNEWKEIFKYEQTLRYMPEEEKLLSFFDYKEIDQFLDENSIKYIFVPIIDTENEDDFFQYYGDRDKIIDKLDKLDYLKRVDAGFIDLVAYENNNYKPKIFVENPENSRIAVEKISSSHYFIEIESSEEQIILNFSDSFHPAWDLYAKEYNYLFQKNILVPSEQTKTFAGINSFKIDLEKLTDSGLAKKDNGVYQLSLSLVFTPQKYTYLGVIISLLTLTILIFYLTMIGAKEVFRKR